MMVQSLSISMLFCKFAEKRFFYNFNLMFSLVIMRADDVRHNRFLMRLMSRNPDIHALGILNGHNCLVAGTYKYSLGEYISAFKQVETMIIKYLGHIQFNQ